MPELITDIRQLRKRRAATPPDPALIPISFDEGERDGRLEVALDELKSKNPLLGELMNLLGLEPVGITQPPGHAQLWELAGQSLRGNRTYSRTEAIEQICLCTSVSQDRAEKGFQLMVEASAIRPTVDYQTGKPNPNLFYLGGSTPY